jgi:hypothetical protein
MMARTPQTQVTMPPLLKAALGYAAQRDGIAPSTKALMILNQGLARTIDSDAFRRHLDAIGELHLVPAQLQTALGAEGERE